MESNFGFKKLKRYKLKSTMKNIIFLAILATICACNPQHKPKGDFGKVIPQDSMILIITDLYIIDAMLTTAVNNKKVNANQTPDYYSYFFVKHNITKERFDNSIKYYSQNKQALLKIYNEVLDRLILSQSTITTK